MRPFSEQKNRPLYTAVSRQDTQSCKKALAANGRLFNPHYLLVQF
jgi:hypothetical protein